jgi:protein SCO1/2
MRVFPLIGLLSGLLFAACDLAPEAPQAEAPPAGPVPGDSVYQLDLELTNQAGERVPFAVHRGHPVLISMFYATCPSACPMLIKDIQAIEASLTPEERASLRVLLVSLDPNTDTPAELQKVVVTHGLDTTRWTLAATAPDRVRDVAAVLGVTWRVMGPGNINHTSGVTLLDGEGRRRAAIDGLKQDPAPLLAALRTGS